MNGKTLLIIILIPIISALIGWITNYIAIKSLFRPKNKINILGFNFQGVIPKRKKIISKKIAQVVAEYLISHKDLIEKFNSKENIEKIKLKVIPIISDKILSKIPIMFKAIAEPLVKSTLEKEAEDIILKIGKVLFGHLEENFNVEQIVEKKLLEYNTTNLEKIINRIAKSEFKHIEYLGGVIGFIVGIFQVILFLIIN